jgi:hypothetical protein
VTYVAYYPGSHDVIDMGANIATVARALDTHPGSRIAALSWWVRFG